MANLTRLITMIKFKDRMAKLDAICRKLDVQSMSHCKECQAVLEACMNS